MKTEKEIQEVHDMLRHLLESMEDMEVPKKHARIVSAINATYNFSCWVLEHDHNTLFNVNLKELQILCGKPTGQVRTE